MGLTRVLKYDKLYQLSSLSNPNPSGRIVSPPRTRTIQLLLQLQLRMLAKRLLARLDRLACPIHGMEGAKHVDLVRVGYRTVWIVKNRALRRSTN